MKKNTIKRFNESIIDYDTDNVKNFSRELLAAFEGLPAPPPPPRGMRMGGMM